MNGPFRARSRVPALAMLASVWLVAAMPRGAAAQDVPQGAPVPAPSLALSDRPSIGCCCISRNEPGTQVACSYGLSEDKCRTAGKAVATWSSSWTPGKCEPR